MRPARFLVFLAITACSPRPREARVAAAISLKEPIEAAQAALGTRGIRFTTVFGASGELARQIAAGSPVDLFASAASTQMEPLERSGRVRRICELAQNELVLVRGKATPSSLRWETLSTDPSLHHLAIGLPKVVPAGDYAVEALTRLGILDALEGRLVRGGNVRQVLDLVARGEAEAGFVYTTDTRGRDDVIVVGPAPLAAQPHIAYPLGEVEDPKRDREAAATVASVEAFLCGPEGREVLSRAGFRAP